MTKPIFIIRFPYIENPDIMEKYLKTYKEIGEQLSDYHVLCPMDSSVERVEFECYTEKFTFGHPEAIMNNMNELTNKFNKQLEKYCVI